MEQELQIDSCLFGGPPVRDDIIKLGESQIGFMNIFARPLFEAVTDILPAMSFAVDEILANKAVWEKKIDDERLRRQKNPKLILHLVRSLGDQASRLPVHLRHPICLTTTEQFCQRTDRVEGLLAQFIRYWMHHDDHHLLATKAQGVRPPSV
jgi:hypothetical protein